MSEQFYLILAYMWCYRVNFHHARRQQTPWSKELGLERCCNLAKTKSLLGRQLYYRQQMAKGDLLIFTAIFLEWNGVTLRLDTHFNLRYHYWYHTKKPTS